MDTIDKILNKYTIGHKGPLKCKCISGAIGHLRVELESYCQEREEKARQEERQAILKKMEDVMKSESVNEERGYRESFQYIWSFINSLKSN